MHDDLISKLSQLSESEFVDVFYKVFSARKQERLECGEIDDAYCISVIGFSKFDGKYDSVVLALPYEGNENISKTQSQMGAVNEGQCTRCKLPIACISKTALCPVCSNEVECT